MPLMTERERIGSRLAEKYDLAAVIGRGGMGTVFRGTHAWTGRSVAVKLLKPSFAEDHGVVRRFLKEARAATTVKHPNVVDVLDMGQDDDGTVYMVLELLEGESLGSVVERCGKLSVRETLDVMIPIADALCEAHAAGFIHRDLKPDNIFLTRGRDGSLVPKVLDFGIAKIVEDTGGTGSTRTGAIIGTPHYMSPEQALGSADVGAATDVWALGVVVYECISGQLPFEADTTTALLVKILTTAPKPLSAVEPGCPPSILSIVADAMTHDVAKRLPDMPTFAARMRATRTELAADERDERPSLADLKMEVPRDIEPKTGETPRLMDSNAATSGIDRRKPSSPARQLLESAPTMASESGLSHSTPPVSSTPAPSSAPWVWVLVGALAMALVAVVAWHLSGANVEPTVGPVAHPADGAGGGDPPTSEPTSETHAATTPEATTPEATTLGTAITDPPSVEGEPAVSPTTEPPEEAGPRPTKTRERGPHASRESTTSGAPETTPSTSPGAEGPIGVRTEW